MDVLRIIADVHVADIDAARSFYTGFLGLAVEEFDLGWVARFAAPGSNGHDQHVDVQLVTRDATAPVDPVASILTPDVASAYAEAQSRGYDIVYPLTRESWGAYRFFVRAPDGNVFNIVNHST